MRGKFHNLNVGAGRCIFISRSKFSMRDTKENKNCRQPPNRKAKASHSRGTHNSDFFPRRNFFGQNERWRKGDDTEKKKSGGEGADLAEAALERWAGRPPLPHRHSVTFPRLDIESRCRRTCTLQSKPYNNLLLQTLLWGGQVGCGLLRGRRYLHPIILSSLHRNPVLCRLSRKV